MDGMEGRNRTVNTKPTKAERVHLERIKSLSCVCCGAPGPSYAHHIRQKSAYHCVPLCLDCHQGPGGIHGDKALWRVYKLDELDALARTMEWMARR